MALPNPNRLLVEDTDLEGVVIGIMKHHIHWGTKADEWPVHIKGKSGKDNIFREYAVEMKGSEVRCLGIVVDADSDLEATWRRVADFCKSLRGNPPLQCPKKGFIINLPDHRFGAWIMPNNELQGMVEHLCNGLVPSHAEKLWSFALQCAETAKSSYAAPFPNLYLPKAHIHTWLAWQETPGERMGQAITSKVLEHASDDAKAFVEWFVELFGLHGKLKTQ